ncbi:MAG TPA: phosphate ABC transporter substrate-binding protein PstS [Candidatus Angelobacter sp.]|nr:phosphate ABC transporter substrate-binding protein PstS [Candidatus Angelobacter sp.]
MLQSTVVNRELSPLLCRTLSEMSLPKVAWRIFCLLLFCFPLFAADQGSVMLVGGGSTVPLPLYKKWKDVYNKRNPAMQMDYVPFGSAEGILEISNGKSDFGAGEVLLSADERAKGSLVELPVAIIGIVPAYNLPAVNEDLKFTGELLAEIFLGDVKNWNDSRISKLNPGASLPNTPIQVIYRPGGKGTNYVFSDFLSKTSPKFREKIGRSPSPSWPVGIPAERSSDMAQKIKDTPGSIGYVELQYVQQYHLSAGSVLNPAGKFVKGSDQSIIAACRAVEGSEWNKFAVSLTNAPGADSFPITSFTWLYVRERSADSRRAAALSDLMAWMFGEGQRVALQEGYPGLPDQLLAKIRAKAASIR